MRRQAGGCCAAQQSHLGRMRQLEPSNMHQNPGKALRGAHHGPLDRLVNVHILEDNHGRLAAQLLRCF